MPPGAARRPAAAFRPGTAQRRGVRGGRGEEGAGAYGLVPGTAAGREPQPGRVRQPIRSAPKWSKRAWKEWIRCYGKYAERRTDWAWNGGSGCVRNSGGDDACWGKDERMNWCNTTANTNRAGAGMHTTIMCKPAPALLPSSKVCYISCCKHM